MRYIPCEAEAETPRRSYRSVSTATTMSVQLDFHYDREGVLTDTILRGGMGDGKEQTRCSCCVTVSRASRKFGASDQLIKSHQTMPKERVKMISDPLFFLDH